jgi:phosphatidylglycerophosphate synthase
MALYSVKPWFQKALTPLADRLVAAGVDPLWLNLLGLGFALAVPAILLIARTNTLAVAGIAPAAIARLACNALDGMVARRRGVATRQGAFLNEIFDRLSDCAVLLGIVFSGRCGPAIGCAALTAVLLSSYCGTCSKASGGQRIFAGIMGKADRMAVVALCGVCAAVMPFEIWTWGMVAIGVGAAVTFVQRSAIALRELRS